MRLRELRIKEGMTQQDLANKVNQTKSTISKYERGALEPSNELLKRFADIFGVTIDYLLSGGPQPIGPDKEHPVTFDDFTYAMYNEGKALSDRDKQTLIDMARLMKQREIKEGRRKPDDK